MEARKSHHSDRFNNYAAKKPNNDPFCGGRCLKAIWRNKNLNDKEKIVLQALAERQDFTKNFQLWQAVSQEDIAEFGSISVGTVKRTLKALNDKGYIQVRLRFKNGKQRTNEYRITDKLFEEYMTQKKSKQEVVYLIKEPKPVVVDVKPEKEMHENIATENTALIEQVDQPDKKPDQPDKKPDHPSPQPDQRDLQNPVFIPSLFSSFDSPLYPVEKNKNEIPKYDKNLTALFASKPFSEKRFLGNSPGNGLEPIENLVAAMELEMKQLKRESFKTG